MKKGNKLEIKQKTINLNILKLGTNFKLVLQPNYSDYMAKLLLHSVLFLKLIYFVPFF